MSENIMVYVDSSVDGITAIRAIRYITRFGLRDSRDIVDKIRHEQRSVEIPINCDISKEEARNYLMGFNFIVETRHFTSTYNDIEIVTVYTKCREYKVKAIKAIRFASGSGIREAKMLVDEMYDTNQPFEIQLDSIRGHEQCVDHLIGAGFDVKGFVRDCFQDNVGLFEI